LALAIVSERSEQAVLLFGAEEALREASGVSRPPVFQPAYEAAVAQLRTALGEPQFATAWEAGRALSLEEAVVEALAQAEELVNTFHA
jgi:hypothetical protein